MEINAFAFTLKFDKISDKIITDISLYNNNKRISGKGLWDTGATFSCISQQVVKALDLTPTGFTNILTPNGGSVTLNYMVNVDLPNYVSFESIQVCESEIGKQGIEMLIGMDIISKGNFSISNYDGKTVFSCAFPSFNHMDFIDNTHDLTVTI